MGASTLAAEPRQRDSNPVALEPLSKWGKGEMIDTAKSFPQTTGHTPASGPAFSMKSPTAAVRSATHGPA